MDHKTVAQKARVKPGTRVAALKPVPGVVESLGLPEPVFVDAVDAQLVFLFPAGRAELAAGLSAVTAELAPGAAVWVFFRKGSKAAGVDMNRDHIWGVAEGLGLRPLGLVSVDDTWSVFRLRPAPAA